MSASQEQTLSGRGARVYTAHRGWLGVVTGIISAASTVGVLVWMMTAMMVMINEWLRGKETFSSLRQLSVASRQTTTTMTVLRPSVRDYPVPIFISFFRLP